MSYTADALVNKLREEEGISISVRTLNYYAYDKKMFPNLSKGKCSFTDEEYELLKRISYLKDKTSMTLDEIRDCITDEEQYSKQVDNVICDSVTRSKSFSVTTGETYSASTTDGPMTVSMRNVRPPKEAFINSVCSALPKNNFEEPRSFNDFMNSSIAQTSYSASCASDSEAFCNSIAYSDNSCSSVADQPTAYNGLYTPTTTMGYADNCHTSAKDNIAQTVIIPSPAIAETKKAYREQDTTVRINKDVTITVSSDVSRERLIEIINFINSK